MSTLDKLLENNMRNLLKVFALFMLSCNGLNARYDQCAASDMTPIECQSSDMSTSDAADSEISVMSSTKNCINLAYICVLYNCTLASEECSRNSPVETCLNCIEKSRNGALCKYFITSCQQTCQE